MNNHIKYPIALVITALALAPAVLAGPGHDHDHDHDHDEKPTATAPTSAPKDDHEHNHDNEHDHDAHADEVALTPEAITQYGIRVTTAKKQAIIRSFSAPARVSFNTDTMAHVGSSVTGRVSELPVKLGDSVKKGDVLAVVDSPELGEAQSDFLLKRTAVDTARPAVQLAKDAFDRAKQLMDQSQGIALSELQKREAELRAAEGALRAAEASATAAENKLHLYGMSQESVTALLKTGEIVPQYRVLAPINGQIVEREITLGELVRPDRDALMIIADLSTIWVIVDVPEARIGEVVSGSTARLSVVAMKGQSLEGRVTYIAPALDPTTRSAKVRVEVQDKSQVLRPGMFAQATLMPAASDATDAVLAIPEEAVQTVEGGPAVFVPVEGEPNTFAKRSITIGAPAAGMVPVLSGLKEGDSFVASGSFILKAELGKSGAAHEH